MMDQAPSAPPRTLRVIGIAPAAAGKAVDLALVESDGAEHIRLVESERHVVEPAGSLAGVIHAARVFIGNRALQPSALDVVALTLEMDALTATDLAAGIGVDRCELHNGEAATRGANRAERTAFEAIAAFVAAGR